MLRGGNLKIDLKVFQKSCEVGVLRKIKLEFLISGLQVNKWLTEI